MEGRRKKKKNERGGRECSPNMVTYRGMSTRQTDHHGGKNEKIIGRT